MIRPTQVFEQKSSLQPFNQFIFSSLFIYKSVEMVIDFIDTNATLTLCSVCANLIGREASL